MKNSFPCAFICILILDSISIGQEPVTPAPLKPKVAKASKEGERAIAGYRILDGVKIELFAAEPMVANPVAIDVDDQGRVFVCETFRQKKAIEDNRDHGHWLDDDLAAQTVADRLAYIKKHLGDAANDYMLHDDRIRLIVDTDRDGRADKATVFAQQFNAIVDGTGAGVLHHQGSVYYTCIPHLWKIDDTTGDGQANTRESLHSGYGVRFAFRGHDMHGLTIGPDGKIYYSIGDRGYNVKSGERHLADPESGAVFRCNPDGSDLEVFYTGLRNPQELAFDDYGNLFTVDNNSDSGDKARLIYLVEGGESGWRMAFQYLSDRGPWNREKLWHPWHDGQPAYINPPITNISDGPSGLTFYPGTGFGDDFNGRFFLCDFRGAAAQSGIRSFRVKPKGAFFEIADAAQPFWNMLPTDIDFGPDGSLYISDWVHGWDGLGKGRIYRLFDPVQAKSPIVAEVRELLAADFSNKKLSALAKLLAHVDRRVRLKSQFSLADRGAFDTLLGVAKKNDSQLARIHALWGIGQFDNARDLPAISQDLEKLLGDDDPEIVAQTAKLVGEIRLKKLAMKLADLLKHENARVRYFASLSISKLGDVRPILAVVDMLHDNADRDPVVRHGGVMALTGLGNYKLLTEMANVKSVPARRGAILALRRLRSPKISVFLASKEEQLVLETARAIHDVPIVDAMPALANLIETEFDDDALLRRVLNANYRLGEKKHALRLAKFATRTEVHESLRVEALEMLRTWPNPSQKDRVLGMWRPFEKSTRASGKTAVESQFEKLTSSNSTKIKTLAVNLAAELKIEGAVPQLISQLHDTKMPPKDRAYALLLLGDLTDDIETEVDAALRDKSVLVRNAARQALTVSNPVRAATELERASTSKSLVERQGAFSIMATFSHPLCDRVISNSLDKLIAGKIPADTQLDLLNAAKEKRADDVQAKLAKFEANRSKDDHLATYRESMQGGSAQRGRQIFFDRREVSCRRCHKIGGNGGDVGPDLSKIGSQKKRDYLLESLVLPSRTMAKGFESILVITEDGLVHSGILKKEDDKVVQMMTATGETFEIEKSKIEERAKAKSAMPEDLVKHLSKSDIRDLVEFLSRQK